MRYQLPSGDRTKPNPARMLIRLFQGGTVFICVGEASYFLFGLDTRIVVVLGLLFGALAAAGFVEWTVARGRRELAARTAAQHAAQARREAAIKHGAAPGQLTELPPGEGSGDLSLQNAPGTLAEAEIRRRAGHKTPD